MVKRKNSPIGKIPHGIKIYSALFCVLLLLICSCSTHKSNELPSLVQHYKEEYPVLKKKKADTKNNKQTDTQTTTDVSVREIGKIYVVQQRALIRRAGKTVPVTAAKPDLHKEDHVFTNFSGKALIQLSEGAEVFMAPSSNLFFNIHLINRLEYEHELSLRGKMRAKVQPVKGGRFIIKTAQATIKVKGTDFIVDSRKGETTVAVLEGAVEVTSTKTKQQTEITGNQLITVSTAGQISKPKKIDPEILKDLEHSGSADLNDTEVAEDASTRSETESIDQGVEVESPSDKSTGTNWFWLLYNWITGFFN